MNLVDDPGLAAYLDKREEGLYSRLLLHRWFEGYVTAVNSSLNQVQVRPLGEAQADGNWYQVGTPGYVPRPGDRGDLIWRDDDVAYFIAPLSDGPAPGLTTPETGLTRQPMTAAMIAIPPVLRLAADVQSISFNNIPQSFRHLKLLPVVQGSDANPQNMQFRVNNDATANYYWGYNYSNTTSPLHAEQAIGQTSGVLGTVTASASLNWAVQEITIFDYVQTRRLNCTFYGWRSDTGSPLVPFNGGSLYAPGGPINLIQLFPTVGNFKAGSEFALYGVL